MLLRLPQLLNPNIQFEATHPPKSSASMGNRRSLTWTHRAGHSSLYSELQGHPGALWELTGLSPFQATLEWFPLSLLPKQHRWDVQKSAGMPPATRDSSPSPESARTGPWGWSHSAVASKICTREHRHSLASSSCWQEVGEVLEGADGWEGKKK